MIPFLAVNKMWISMSLRILLLMVQQISNMIVMIVVIYQKEIYLSGPITDDGGVPF